MTKTPARHDTHPRPAAASTEVKARHVAGQAAEASGSSSNTREDSAADWLAERRFDAGNAGPPKGVGISTQGAREAVGNAPVLESRRGSHK